MNYLVAAEAGAGHACQLAVALRKYIPLESIYTARSAFGLDWIDPQSKIGAQHIPKKGGTLIVVSAYAYNFVKDVARNFDRVIVIMTDSGYMINYKKWNETFRPFEVFVTNCKMQYREGLPTKVYYQPFDLSMYNTKKYNTLTVCHSPFMAERTPEKGTDIIMDVLRRNRIMHDLIMGADWRKCMQRKAKCHIFVDQIKSEGGHWDNPADWKGGIGKSGLEAMLLKCYTISRGNFKDYDIPKPPVVECTEKTFESVLLASLKIDREPIINQQYEWAKTYLDPDFCAKRILNIP
jgi:hypothetical protein